MQTCMAGNGIKKVWVFFIECRIGCKADKEENVENRQRYGKRE